MHKGYCPYCHLNYFSPFQMATDVVAYDIHPDNLGIAHAQ